MATSAPPPLTQRDAKDTAPAQSAAAVSLDNSNDLPIAPTRALYIGVAGDVKVDMADGSTVTFTAVPNGMFPVAVKRVYLTGTTATNIAAVY